MFAPELSVLNFVHSLRSTYLSHKHHRPTEIYPFVVDNCGSPAAKFLDSRRFHIDIIALSCTVKISIHPPGEFPRSNNELREA